MKVVRELIRATQNMEVAQKAAARVGTPGPDRVGSEERHTGRDRVLEFNVLEELDLAAQLGGEPVQDVGTDGQEAGCLQETGAQKPAHTRLLYLSTASLRAWTSTVRALTRAQRIEILPLHASIASLRAHPTLHRLANTNVFLRKQLV